MTTIFGIREQRTQGHQAPVLRPFGPLLRAIPLHCLNSLAEGPTMRALTWLLILVLGVLLAAIAVRAHADAIARHGADWVQLTEAPCTDAAVVSKITEAGQDASDYRAASAEFNGRHFSACWRLLPGQPYAYMRYEDGDAGLIPFADLHPLKQT